MNLPSNLFDGNVSIQTFLCQPDKEIIGEILPYDFNATFKFNTYSEISFTIDRYYNDLFEGTTKVNPYYDLVESLRVIYVRGVGHFVIQDVDEDVSENESKSITCFSLEYSTGQKYLENFYVNTGEEGSVETMYYAQFYGAEYSIDNYYQVAKKYNPYRRYYIKEYTDSNAYNYVETQIIDEDDFNSYDGSTVSTTLYDVAYKNVQFYDPDLPELSLLHLVFDRIPEWKIGHVDKELYHQERTFSEDRTAVYDFLYNTAAETLDFVMVWDSINGVVNFYKTTEDGVTADEEIETQWNTDVFISRENLASALDIKYSTDDIKTQLKITGSDDLDVRDVNLGQNYILNLSYYNTPLWLGEDLHLKYNAYTNDLAKYTAQYKEFVSAWSAAYNKYSDLMNHVPAEPRIMLVGDVFEKLYCVYNKYKPAPKEFTSELTYYKYDTKTLAYYIASPQPQNNQDLKNEQYYVVQNLNIEDGVDPVQILVKRLQTKLDRYKVDQEDDETRSPMAKTDDVLLTLENDASDSVTIRVRYTASDASDKPTPDKYRVFRTLTMASTGISNTIEYDLYDWVDGQLTANKLGLEDENIVHPFKIKSIGTLGAYFCLVRDEAIKENLEDYGIRLLREKQDTYTKVFITQTEGYMNEEGSQCVTSNEEPKGNEYPVGTKWLDTENTKSDGSLIMKIRTESGWVDYTPDGNDYENYARFYENYTKLGNVQTVLAEKQRVADYLLNGIAMRIMHLTDDNINLKNLLRAAILHFIVLDNDCYITSLGDAFPTENIKEGSVWLHTVNNGYSLYTILKQYKNGDWVDTDIDITKISLTGYDEYFGIATFIVDPQYTQAFEHSSNDVYFLYKDGIYIKPQIQPINTDELTKMYECVVSEDINKDAKCFFKINDVYYSFIAPQNIKKDSTLVYNASTNTLIIGIDSIEPDVTEDITDMIQLQFINITYYIIEGTEYAVYVNNGTPYVSYSYSQGMYLSKMNVIKEASDMNNYFTEQELVRLSPFIREDEYSDSNFLLTSYESEEEQMNIKQELLNAGNEELKKICQPKLSFDATMANILAIPEFTPLRKQFKLGNFIRIGIRDGYVKRARLLEVQINFDDPSDFSATFGDLISTRSEIDKHAELLQQAVTAGKSVASNQSKWQKGADKATELDRAINDGLRNAALSIGAADGQAIVWDKYGIRGRKLIDGTTDQYHDEQFALINNKLAFTTDNWKTSRAVVGEFEVEIDKQKQTMYGLLADALIGGYIQGTEIRGGNLRIGDGSNNYFQVDENGDVKIVQAGKEKYASADAVSVIDTAYKYSVQIIHTGKAVFSSKSDTATMTAQIYRRGVDVTDVFKTAGVIVYWEKNPSEAGWVPNYTTQGNTYSIILDSVDVQNSVQVSCYIDPTDEQLKIIESKYND